MENKYDPYCPVCSGCGEEGCCSPLICEQSPDGHYCETYLRDLKFGYSMDKFFQENIYPKLGDEWKELYDKEWDKIYDKVYGCNDIPDLVTKPNEPNEELANELFEAMKDRTKSLIENQITLDPEFTKVMDDMLKSKIGNKPTKDRNYE